MEQQKQVNRAST